MSAGEKVMLQFYSAQNVVSCLTGSVTFQIFILSGNIANLVALETSCPGGMFVHKILKYMVNLP